MDSVLAGGMQWTKSRKRVNLSLPGVGGAAGGRSPSAGGDAGMINSDPFSRRGCTVELGEE